MPWAQLDEVGHADLNPDVEAAIRATRAALRSLDLAYLDAAAVTCDVEHDDRGVYFLIPHREDGTVVEMRHGDGWTYLRTPFGTCHGSVRDDEFGEYLVAALTGRVVRLSRRRGGVEVSSRWDWCAVDGTRRCLARSVRWSQSWRLLVPVHSQAVASEAVHFGRSPAISATT